MGKEGPRQGSVDRSRVKHVKQHELDTANRLAELGEDVTFIPARGTDRVADIEMNAVRWELKSPTSSNPNTIRTRLGRGATQAVNIVLDLARTPIAVDEAITIAEQAIERYPQIEVIRIIGRETEQGLLDITVER
jgi:Contact-dependent growth inhibition CdiA C-terminal domain